MEDAVRQFGVDLLLVAGALAFVDWFRNQFNIPIPVENVVSNFFSRLSEVPTIEIPRFIIRTTLGVLGRLASVLNVIAGISLVLAIFFLVHIVSYAYGMNGAADAFEQIRPAVKAYRDFQFWVYLGIAGGAFLLGIAIGLSENIEEKTGETPSFMPALYTTMMFAIFAAFVASIYVTSKFALAHYTEILQMSLSGAPLQAIKTQFVLFPLNSMAFGFPALAISIFILAVPRIRRVLARALLGEMREWHELEPVEQTLATNQIISRLGLTAGLTASFVITAAAIAIGIYSTPIDSFEMSTQLFLSNVLFDALTLLTTVILLGWALGKFSWVRLPIAIAVDVFLACVFAVCSIYFGLLGSTNEITIQQSVSQLVGQDALGNAIEFGPLFWTMHTAFIPTLVFWCLIVSVLVGKIVLVVLGRCLRLDVKVAALTYWGGLFGAIGTVLVSYAGSITGGYNTLAHQLTSLAS